MCHHLSLIYDAQTLSTVYVVESPVLGLQQAPEKSVFGSICSSSLWSGSFISTENHRDSSPRIFVSNYFGLSWCAKYVFLIFIFLFFRTSMGENVLEYDGVLLDEGEDDPYFEDEDCSSSEDEFLEIPLNDRFFYKH